MGLMLTHHGGKCCAIKHIHGFYGDPDSTESALEAIQPNNKDAHGWNISSDERFFHEAAPSESTRARLERYIDFMKRKRPKNIIEVCLVLTEGPWNSQTIWVPVLKELGFKRVNRTYNSNSGNVVGIFHLNIDQAYPGSPAGLPFGEETEPYDEEEED